MFNPNPFALGTQIYFSNILNMNSKTIKTFAFLLLVSISFITKAQSFELGIQGGPGFSNIKGAALGTNNKTVFHYGLVGQYNINKKWAITAKALYDNKGFEYSHHYASGKESSQYINVPIMAKWHIGNKVRAYIQAGGFIGLHLSSEHEFIASQFTPQSGYTSYTATVDSSSNFKGTDFGLTTGLGLETRILNKLKFFFELEYAPGLADITKSDATINNRAGRLGLGLRYDFGSTN